MIQNFCVEATNQPDYPQILTSASSPSQTSWLIQKTGAQNANTSRHLAQENLPPNPHHQALTWEGITKAKVTTTIAVEIANWKELMSAVLYL